MLVAGFLFLQRGPPKGYIEAIENRLHKLEQILEDFTKGRDDPKSKAVLAELHTPLKTATGEQIRTRPVRRGRGRSKNISFLWQSPVSDSNQSTASPLRGSSSSSSPQLIGSPTLPPEDDPGSPDSAGDGTGQLSMDESGQVRYLGKSSGFYLLQNSRTYHDGAFHFAGLGHKRVAHPKLKSLDPLELPPKDLSLHLIRLYFKHFYPVLPLFYKKHLTSSMDPVSQDISPLLLNAIYAVASRMSPDVRVRTDPNLSDTAGDIFFERAKCLLDDYYDVPRISTVQALLLLASHQQGAMRTPRAWLYSGMAFRMAQDLGLHRNCDHWNIPQDERERRKRVFWCCFIVDRLLSATFGRASVFEERDCDVPFPTIDDDDEIRSEEGTDGKPVKLLESFVHLIKISDILGHVCKNIYYAKAHHHAGTQHLDQLLAALNRQLTNWHNTLPSSLQYHPPGQSDSAAASTLLPPSVLQMHMIYYTTVILLHRPFIPGSPNTPSPLSLPSFNICMSAANSILDISNQLLERNQLKFVLNFTIYYIFTAGIIFIKSASANDSDKAMDAKIKINQIMRALDEIELTWNNAARTCSILGELAGLRDINLEKCDQVVSSPPPLTESSSKQSTDYATAPRNEWISSSQTPSRSMSTPVPSRNNCQNYRLPWISQPQASPTSSAAYMATAPTVDPFAAPDTITASQQQFDPLGSAFWGMPPSLDLNEWNNYLGGGASNNQQRLQGLQPAAQPLIPSYEFTPVNAATRFPNGISSDMLPHQDQQQQRIPHPLPRKDLIHNDDAVDVLSGISVSASGPTESLLLGFLGGQNDPGPSPQSIHQTYGVNSGMGGDNGTGAGNGDGMRKPPVATSNVRTSSEPTAAAAATTATATGTSGLTYW